MRRLLLMSLALAAMIGVAAVALQQGGSGRPVLDWARKATAGPARIAVLLEMGLMDNDQRDWSGKARVIGARVVQREGYRFRKSDKLQGEEAWQVSSHRALRAAKQANPVVTKTEPVATIGIVWQLEEVNDGARIRVEIDAGDKAEVAVAELRSGKTLPLWNGQAAIRLVATAQPLAAAPTEDDMPAAAYGPDGTLWVVYSSYTVREDQRRIETANIKEQPGNFAKFYTPELGDQVRARYLKEGKWSDEIAVSGPAESICGTAVAADASGAVHVAYSTFRDGIQGVWSRALTRTGAGKVAVGAEEKRSSDGSALWPAMTTDRDGAVWLAYQSWRKGGSSIAVHRRTNGTWKAVHDTNNNLSCWHASLAASPNGDVALVHDVYRSGNYDIRAVIFSPSGDAPRTLDVAGSPKFEARPAAIYDGVGRLWVAFEEGPEKWGKDYGALVPGKGMPLYNERNVRVVAVEPDGRTLMAPVAELPRSKVDPPVIPFEPIKTGKFERATRYAYPRIGLDGSGRLWLSYRQNFGTRYTTHPGAYWLTFVRRLDDNRWSEPVELHHSDGLLDHRPVLLPHPGGGLLAIHNTDGRMTTPEVIDNQIYASAIDLPQGGAVPALRPHDPGANPQTAENMAEMQAVLQMRTARISSGGNKYVPLRGEYHRHTEISWDGAPDGSLEDMFRYAIDAASFDWIGNGDHDNGAGREYSWWLTQKFSDAYRNGSFFVPMFTYERSVAYPHGHRNVMFAQRGVRTLPRLAPPGDVKKAEGGVHPDDTKMLYRYLHEHGGICAVHTSATSMGTDWRDNDPVVEPIVEIYQGDRMSYEHEDAPRAGYDPKEGKDPANIAGWFPKGFVNLALQKGYRLAFQASSDHWSTHISFFIILAEKNDRQSILDAIKKRRCYGATDNIVVDWRSGETLMGGETKGPPAFQLTVSGTGPLAKVEILRDSTVVAKLPTTGSALKAEWTDPQPQNGTHYYYARILQSDGEIAWASPIWVSK